jgi:DNA primase
MRWSDDTIMRVKEANDVVEVINAQVPLKKAGSTFKALCPFHQEKTPSFTVNPSRQIFHCFGCDTGGDVIRFVMLYEGLPFTDAVKKLAARAGVDLPEEQGERGPGRDVKDQLVRANTIAAEYFTEVLMRSPGGEGARKYLKERGIHADVCRTFGMGFAPEGWRNLAGKLKEEGVAPGMAVQAGLLVEGTGGKEDYDRFRNRIVFPIRDIAGRVLGFGGRVMGDDMPKYINTSETPVYRKGDSLFGMDVAASAIREEGYIILVEGYMDVIALHQGGIRNVVGVLGTALTAEQARRIKRLSTDIVILFDSDEAGRKAALRSGLILLEENFSCRITPLAEGEDPDSYLQGHGADALRELVDASDSIIAYVLEEARKKYPGDRLRDKFQVIDAILPYLAKISDRAKLGVFLKEIGDGLKIEQHDLRARLASGRKAPVPAREEVEKDVPLPRRESLLLHIMVRDPSTVPKVKKYVHPEDFTAPGTPQLVEKIFSGVNVNALADNLGEKLSNKISRWALEDPVEGTEQALEDCLLRFVEEKLERDIQIKSERLKEAVVRGDAKTSQELNEEWKKLQADLVALKGGKGLPQ